MEEGLRVITQAGAGGSGGPRAGEKPATPTTLPLPSWMRGVEAGELKIEVEAGIVGLTLLPPSWSKLEVEKSSSEKFSSRESGYRCYK